MDCNASRGAPAFEFLGNWRGARHVCRTRDLDALAAQIAPLPLDPMLQPGDYCFATLEPDRLNVRPDGAEVVIVDDLATDAQNALFPARAFAALAICDRDDDGDLELGVERDGFLNASQAPAERSLILPIRVEAP